LKKKKSRGETGKFTGIDFFYKMGKEVGHGKKKDSSKKKRR
jgi:hypothetical protein